MGIIRECGGKMHMSEGNEIRHMRGLGAIVCSRDFQADRLARELERSSE